MPTFDTPAPISATVDIILGDIRFIAGDRADTVVEVHPVDPSRKLDVEAAEQVDIKFADGKLLVRHSKLRTAFTTKYGSVKVLVELPTGSDVRGDTADGEYVVQGLVGSCRLKNAIGDIRVGQAADVRLKTTGGRVIVDHVTGQADVSANGDIRIRRIGGGAVVKNIGGDSWVGEVAGDLRANSATGDIAVDVARAAVNARTSVGDIRVGELGSGPVDLYTAIGRVEVGVPQGTAVRLDAHTSTGRVRNHLAGPDAPGQSGPTVKVRARCNGGDIIVRRAGADHDAKQREARFSG
ncbi:DUF4097 family beta strand repeat-containing protein [Catellatospora sichuanensis]|uniref:DUF4097 family beta strand repeat-containing protein n=1 Tax=Catellatospora sichuanensis TaxID=1969805 RepID=UPI0011841AEE|nr:DUF4097 family beta strand repeat-containing protein [Catellatospora sichuanensis]